MITATDKLGIGIYTPEEAAFYARVKTQVLNRWLFGDGRGANVVKPERCGKDEDRIVTFLDLVQAIAIRRQTTGLRAAVNTHRGFRHFCPGPHLVTSPCDR